MRPKNRVWGFSAKRRIYSIESRPQSPELRQKSRPTPTFFTVGIPQWPSRDPIEEDGGVNLYGFVGNDGVGKLDIMGLNTVTLTLTRSYQGWFAIYGDLIVTADDAETAKCCGFPLQYKTLESPGVTLKSRGRYTPAWTPENTTGDDDGYTSISGKYNDGLKKGYWNKNTASLPDKPSTMSQSDYDDIINREFHSTKESGLNIHFGPNTNHSTGCVLIGHQYILDYQVLSRGMSDRFDASLQRDVPYLVPRFDLQDSINSQFELFSAIKCAVKRGANLSYVITNNAPARDVRISLPHPVLPTKQGQIPKAEWISDLIQ